MEESTNIPQLASPEEAAAEQERQAQECEAERVRRRDEELQPYWLDPRLDYPEPYFLLEYNGVPFSTIGGLQAMSGQKKNGKTFVLTMFMAAILGRGSQRVQDFLPGLTVPERTIDYLGHEPKVLFVDTEMEKLSSAKVLRRVHWLCGWDMKQPDPRFNTLWLRSVKKSEKEEVWSKRFRLIKNAIEAVSPDFVIIDGLRDILPSINDETVATSVISELSAIAEERQMCIWNALHQNPRPSNDIESKMRGWAGTELGNKVSDTFLSIKKKQGADVVFTVKQDDARNKDVQDFQYIITDAAGNLGIPKIITQGGSTLEREIKRANDEEQTMLYETIRVLKAIIYPPKSEYFTEIMKQLKDKLHVGEAKAKKYFNMVKDNYPTMMYQRDGGKFTIDKREMEAIEQGLPWAPETSEP